MKSTRRGIWFSLFTSVLLVSFGSQVRADHVENGHLTAVGPTAPDHRFPVWYRDATGLALEICLDGADPLCNFEAGAVPNPTLPISFPGNFPDEAFWWAAEAEMTTSGGDALLVMALEAAFAVDAVADGDQIVFGRIRLRIDLLNPGHYRITHPYGVDEFDIVQGATGRRAINHTEDIGGGRLDFQGALQSRIGPFLTWDPIAEAPLGYVGDPAIGHRVTGSPFNTNVFRIEGPGIGVANSPFLCTQGNLNCVQTDLFFVQGKISTIAGLDGDRVSYGRTPAGVGSLSAFVSSTHDQQITVTGTGIAPTPMIGEGERYYASIGFTGAVPQVVTITNSTDNPPSTKVIRVVDDVTIVRANFDSFRGELLVEAFSSDQASPPTLTVPGFGPLVGPVTIFPGIIAPPAYLTVVSSAGGSDTEPVAIDGSAIPPPPVIADPGAGQTVISGQFVILDGSGSTGAISSWSWTQIGGPAVLLQNANSSTPFFVAPTNQTSAAILLTFQLTVQGASGSSSGQVVVTILPTAIPPVIANAGFDRQAGVGTTVTLDGSASTGGSTFFWEQIGGGPTVTLSGANTMSARFVFPAGASPLVFQLTVTGPGGVSTASVTISPVDDVLVVTRAEYIQRFREWTVVGRSSMGTGNRISIYLANGTTLVATVDADAQGNWAIRGRRNNVIPGANETLVIRSSAGGSISGVPLTQFR